MHFQCADCAITGSTIYMTSIRCRECISSIQSADETKRILCIHQVIDKRLYKLGGCKLRVIGCRCCSRCSRSTSKCRRLKRCFAIQLTLNTSGYATNKGQFCSSNRRCCDLTGSIRNDSFGSVKIVGYNGRCRTSDNILLTSKRRSICFCCKCCMDHFILNWVLRRIVQFRIDNGLICFRFDSIQFSTICSAHKPCSIRSSNTMRVACVRLSAKSFIDNTVLYWISGSRRHLSIYSNIGSAFRDTGKLLNHFRRHKAVRRFCCNIMHMPSV